MDMKKFLLTTLICICALQLKAQDVIEFMGVPLCGSDTTEYYKRFLSSHIKAITDAEDVKIKLKHEKTLKGKDVLLNKAVNIERLDRFSINETDLIYEMKTFLKELES